LQAFDLLYLNGESLITEELHARRERLYESFQEVQGTFMFVQKRDLEEVEEIQAYLNEAVENQTEGLMVKTLEGPDSCYEIAKRSYNWLKVSTIFMIRSDLFQSFNNTTIYLKIIMIIVEEGLFERHDRHLGSGAYWSLVR
jgi:ATP-dependent DNA ligase